MSLLAQGVGVTDISRRLLVSRHTVYRCKRAATVQALAVPVARPAGGYRWSRLDRSALVGLARLSLAQPKATLDELLGLAVVQGIIRWRVSVSLHRLARPAQYGPLAQARLLRRRAHRDGPRIALERCLFREAQRTDADLAADR